MSRHSWVAVTDFKTWVLRLKPEVQILVSSRSIHHTKVEILHLKSCFLHKKETKLHANLWKIFSNELFCQRSWWFYVTWSRSSSARPVMPFLPTKCLMLKQWEASAEHTFCQNPPQKLFMVLQYRTKHFPMLPFTPYALANRWSHKNKTYLFVSMGGFLLS